jgi:cytosine/adenosine deaminase-related metal-dependent hydrolase
VFEVMRIALLTERFRRTDAFPGVRPQTEDILADATEGGSRAVNQQKTIGSLEVGKKADLFVLGIYDRAANRSPPTRWTTRAELERWPRDLALNNQQCYVMALSEMWPIALLEKRFRSGRQCT